VALMGKRGRGASLVDRLRPSASRRERSAPTSNRRAAGGAKRLVAGVNGILFSEALAEEGAVVFAEACQRSERRLPAIPPSHTAPPRESRAYAA
jgi:hypothetical protein